MRPGRHQPVALQLKSDSVLAVDAEIHSSRNLHRSRAACSTHAPYRHRSAVPANVQMLRCRRHPTLVGWVPRRSCLRNYFIRLGHGEKMKSTHMKHTLLGNQSHILTQSTPDVTQSGRSRQGRGFPASVSPTQTHQEAPWERMQQHLRQTSHLHLATAR